MAWSFFDFGFRISGWNGLISDFVVSGGNGYWLLATGYWLQAAGHKPQAAFSSHSRDFA
jgi:hypothetical protein